MAFEEAKPLLVSLPALPAVDPSVGGAVGGTETRAWTLAKGLAAAGAEPTLIVRGVRDEARIVDGVRVEVHGQPMYRRYEEVGRGVVRAPQFPFLRVTRPSLSLAWNLPLVAAHRVTIGPPGERSFGRRLTRLLEADPHLVPVAFGVQSTALRVVRTAAEIGRPSVVAVGCDDDLDARYVIDPAFVNPYGDRGADCAAAVRGATQVIVQTSEQLAALRERFGRDGVLVPNPIDVAAWSPDVAPKPPDGIAPGYVLWVGRAEAVHKRPELAIELAARCPEQRFLMVLNPADPAVEKRVRRSVSANVDIISFVPPPAMPVVVAASSAVVNTSAVEGFANVLLQAAAVGRPVYSLAAMSDWLAKSRAGRAFEGDLDAMAAALRERAVRSAARDHVVRHHALPSVVERFRAAVPRPS